MTYSMHEYMQSQPQVGHSTGIMHWKMAISKVIPNTGVLTWMHCAWDNEAYVEYDWLGILKYLGHALELYGLVVVKTSRMRFSIP